MKKRLLFSYQRHSKSIILILLREKVSVLKLKSNAQMVADGYKSCAINKGLASVKFCDSFFPHVSIRAV